MALPERAMVEAAPNFLANLEDARRFLQEQDEITATGRYRRLQGGLREMVTLLAWSPGSGRPARFFSGRSAQARLRAEQVRQLADQAGLPHLREYLVDGYVVLYAHSAIKVMLLALKHQRQLGYSVT